MKRTLIALGTALLILIPATALALYEQSWFPGTSGNPIAAPDYDNRPIPVKDCVRGTITNTTRRAMWVDARNQAFGSQNGLKVQQLIFDPQSATCSYPISNPQSDVIYLVRDDDNSHCSSPGAAGCGGFALTSSSPRNGYGFATFRISAWNWNNGVAILRGHIAHESGHALGFFESGGNGVMGGGSSVSVTEENALLDYYRPSGGGPGCGPQATPLC
jgi:hypothetical protein